MLNYELNLRDYFRIIRKRRLIIIFTALTVGGFAHYFANRQPKIFKVSTTLKVAERKSMGNLLTEMTMYRPGDVMTSYTRLISGFSVLRKAAVKVGMLADTDGDDKSYRVVARIQGMLATQILERTNLIEISLRGGDQTLITNLANAISKSFIEENVLEKNKQVRTVRLHIEKQLSDVEDRIKTGALKLKAFEDSVQNVKFSKNIEDKMVDLQFSLVEMQRKYTDNHPRVRQVKEQIKTLQGELSALSMQALDYESIKRQLDVNKKLYGVLKEKLEDARINEIQKIEDISLVNPAVRPNQPINPPQQTTVVLGFLLGAVLGITIAFVMESLDTSLGTIEDVESVLKLPVLGVVPSVRQKNHRKMRLFQLLKKKLFFASPDEIKDSYVRLIVHLEPKSSVAEAYRAIRTNMQISDRRKTFLVTSAGPREGKTTTLVNIGLAIAQTGARTLLISSDLRRPAVAGTFGLPESPGLNEVVTGVKTLDECLFTVTDMMLGEMDLEMVLKTPGIENITILPCGHIPHNPAELLTTDKMSQVNAELKRRFDVILYDSPPVLPITDAALLSSFADAVVLVYEAGRTSRSALARVKAQIEQSGASICGIVLNHTSREVDLNVSFPYYKNKYYYYYNYYYGEGGKASKPIDNGE
jgi:tyrosine-protein kinase Etk/Wzc